MSDSERRDRRVLMEAALAIDWDQQNASRYFIGEDAAQSILVRLNFPWENGICNEAVEAHVKELNQPHDSDEEVNGT